MNRISVLLLGLFSFATLDRLHADDLTISAERTIASGATVAQPRVALGGKAYFIVWQDGWPGINATADIRGLRLDAKTLEPLDKEPLRICTAPDAQEMPAVAYADGVFLVVWQDFRSGNRYDIRGILIDAQTGQPRGSEIVIASQPGNQVRPAVASDGKTFFVVWQQYGSRDGFAIRGVRLSPAGKILDATPHEYSASGTSPTVSVSGNKVLVGWSNRDRNRATTAAALVDAATGEKVKFLGTLNTCCGDDPKAAGDGLGNFTTVASRAGAPDPWGWGGPGAVVLSRVADDGTTPESKINYAYRLSNLCSRSVPNVIDAAVWKGSKTWDAGAVGGFPGTQDGLWPKGSPAVVHAGKDLVLFAWVKGDLGKDKLTVSHLNIWIRGMDAKTLALRVPDQKAAAALDVDETHPTLIEGPGGEVMLLYECVKTGADRRLAVRRISIAANAK